MTSDTMNRLRQTARMTAGLRLLVLHGSRASAAAHAHSDWDFAFVAATTTDVAMLSVALCDAVRSNQVDLVNLATATGVLRWQVASGGQLVFERDDAWYAFRYAAAEFWCDAGPIIRRAQRRFLDDLQAARPG